MRNSPGSTRRNTPTTRPCSPSSGRPSLVFHISCRHQARISYRPRGGAGSRARRNARGRLAGTAHAECLLERRQSLRSYIPGSNWGDVVGFQGANRGEYARGLFYALQPDRSYRLIAAVALVNPVAPVDALVTNRGELVTLDNWHNFGFGAVLAVYDPAGALRASYTLESSMARKAVGCAAVGVVAVVAMPTDRVRRSRDGDSYLHSRVSGRRVRSRPVTAVVHLPSGRSRMLAAARTVVLDLVGRVKGGSPSGQIGARVIATARPAG